MTKLKYRVDFQRFRCNTCVEISRNLCTGGRQEYFSIMGYVCLSQGSDIKMTALIRELTVTWGINMNQKGLQLVHRQWESYYIPTTTQPTPPPTCEEGEHFCFLTNYWAQPLNGHQNWSVYFRVSWIWKHLTSSAALLFEATTWL